MLLKPQIIFLAFITFIASYVYADPASSEIDRPKKNSH